MELTRAAVGIAVLIQVKGRIERTVEDYFSHRGREF
jgi:hypothetical protein